MVEKWGDLRYQVIKSATHGICRVPGLKALIRPLARWIIQHSALSLKNKQRIYNYFAQNTVPDAAMSFNVRLPFTHPTRTLKLHLELQDGLSRTWFYWGYTGYERGVTKLFCEVLKDKTCVFDIGANIGYYTFLAAALLESRGVVYAFEPSPDVFQILSHNAHLNELANVVLNQAALCAEDGTGRLFLPSTEEGDSHQTNASLIEGFMSQQGAISVKTLRFDTYCAKAGIKKVDLIKIDVEGVELQVLQGMGELLQSWLPDIICEVLPPWDNALDSFFAGTPYRKFLITDNGLKEVDRIEANPHFRDYYLSCSPVNFL